MSSAERLARIAVIVRLMQADAEVPEEVVDAAIALFDAMPARPPATPDLGRLVFDSSAAGSSRAAPSGARLMRFETSGNVDLQLLVTQGQDAVSVAGQLTARKTGGPLSGTVSAHRESGLRAIAFTRSNESGEFRLDYAPPVGALLRFVVAGVMSPIHVLVTPEAVG